MANKPKLWNEIKSLAPEIKQLSPMLLNGSLTKLSTGVEDIFAGIWIDQNQVVVVVLNTSHRSTKEVSIQLPYKKNTKIKPMFSHRPSGMSVIDNKLSGVINPLDVHVYKVKN